MSKNESDRVAKSRLLPKRSVNSMKKPKIIDLRFNSFMTKTLKKHRKRLTSDGLYHYLFWIALGSMNSWSLRKWWCLEFLCSIYRPDSLLDISCITHTDPTVCQISYALPTQIRQSVRHFMYYPHRAGSLSDIYLHLLHRPGSLWSSPWGSGSSRRPSSVIVPVYTAVTDIICLKLKF